MIIIFVILYGNILLTQALTALTIITNYSTLITTLYTHVYVHVHVRVHVHVQYIIMYYVVKLSFDLN